MATQSQRLVSIFAGIENPAGTLQTTASKLYLLPHDGATYGRQIDKQKDENVIGQMSNYNAQYVVRNFSAGDIGGFIHADSIGMFMTLMFGGVPATTGTTTLTHNWTKSETTTGSAMSVYRFSADNYKESSRLARLSQLKLDFMADSYATFTASLIGQPPETSTITAPTINQSTSSRFKPNDISVKIAANQAGIATATAVECKSCEFTYASKLSGYAALGTTGYAEILSSGYDVMINLTTLFKDDTERDLWINDTERYVQIEATGAAIGATTPKLTLNIPLCKIESWEDSKGVGDFTEQTFTLTSLPYSSATTFSGELVNTTANTAYGG